MKKFKKIALVLALGTLTLAIAACGKSDKKEVADGVNRPIKVGLVGTKHEEWDAIKDKLGKEGTQIELVEFTDYNQPNEALLAGDVDLNAFQHQIFLDNFNKEKNSNLVSIGDTQLAPLGIYSKKIKDVKELKVGDKIPNDVTNGARAIKLLQTAGLIKAKDVEFPTDKDIVENKLNLEIIPVDASQTARSLDDVAAAAINNNVATDAGYIPTKDAIFLEPVDKNSKPYINIIVARPDEKDNEAFKKIVKAYQTDDTKKIIEKTTKGSSIPAWDIQL